MKMCHSRWDATLLRGLTVLMLITGAWVLTSCKDDSGLTEGDPNYFTSSRGQFTATLSDGTTLYLLAGDGAGTATLTYDGSNPRHWQSETTATVSVTTYQGDLTLPETVSANGKTYTLTGIGEEALMGCRSLTSVTLPNTIQWLGEGAFAICRGLISITIPEGVTEIPIGCFGYCSVLTTANLPASVTTIAKMAFDGCSGMTSITLPANLKRIGEMAFFDCSKLTAITIPASVTSIGNRAFGGRNATLKSKITEYHMQSATPPTLEGVLYEAQDGVSPIIYVPTGSKAAYEAADGWSSLTIEEE